MGGILSNLRRYVVSKFVHRSYDYLLWNEPMQWRALGYVYPDGFYLETAPFRYCWVHEADVQRLTVSEYRGDIGALWSDGVNDPAGSQPFTRVA